MFRCGMHAQTSQNRPDRKIEGCSPRYAIFILYGGKRESLQNTVEKKTKEEKVNKWLHLVCSLYLLSEVAKLTTVFDRQE